MTKTSKQRVENVLRDLPGGYQLKELTWTLIGPGLEMCGNSGGWECRIVDRYNEGEIRTEAYNLDLLIAWLGYNIGSR